MPAPDGRPRIGIIHDLHCHGGVATYHLTLSENPSSRVAWSAMAVPILQRFNPALFRRLERPVFSPESLRGGTEGLVTKVDDWPAAVQAVVDRSDIILMWGKLIVPGLERVDFQGKPVVVQAFGACQWTRDLVKDLVPFSTHGMAISAAAAATFPSRFRDRVRVCWPGIAAEEARPTTSREQVRREWGLAPGDRALGYLGRISPEKNPWLLLDLLSEDSRTHLIYAGDIWHTEVPPMDPARRGRVHLLPPPRRMPDVLVGLDALVLASPSEGFSLLLIEAWANRIPTIATRVGSVPELERQQGEMVIPLPRSPRADHLRLAVELLDSPEVETIVENAHRVVREQLTAGNAGSRFEEIVEWALGSG